MAREHFGKFLVLGGWSFEKGYLFYHVDSPIIGMDFEYWYPKKIKLIKNTDKTFNNK